MNEPPNSQPSPSLEPDPKATTSAPLRIFLVENDRDTLKVLKRQLEKMGHEVCTAMNMADALEAIPTSDCRILLSDIGLPDGDGWELLKALTPHKGLYAIAMSGYGAPSDRRASVDAGYKEHLLKPFTCEHLKAVLKRAQDALSSSPSHAMEA